MPDATGRITKTPNVCGGRACIRGHRLPVWGFVSYRRLGMTDADLLAYYPDITAADLEAAWAYAAAHPDEIDRDIRENEADVSPWDILDRLRRRPFVPFRLVLDGGPSYDIRDPGQLLVARDAVVVGLPGTPGQDFYETTVSVDLLHIIRLDPLP